MAEKKSGAIKIDWNKREAQFSPNVKLVTKKVQAIANAPDTKETIIRFEISTNKIESSECQTYFFTNDNISDLGPINEGNPWYFDFCGEIIIIPGKKAPPHEPVKEKIQEKVPPHAPVKEKIQKKVPAKVQEKIQEKGPEKIPEAKLQLTKPILEIDEDEIVRPSSLFETLKQPPSETPDTPKPSFTQQTAATEPAPLFKALKTPDPGQAPTPISSPPIRPSTSNLTPSTKLKIPPPNAAQEPPLTIGGQILQLEDQLTSTRNIVLTLDKRLAAGLFNLSEYLEKKNFLIKKIEKIKVDIEDFKKKNTAKP